MAAPGRSCIHHFFSVYYFDVVETFSKGNKCRALHSNVPIVVASTKKS